MHVASTWQGTGENRGKIKLVCHMRDFDTGMLPPGVAREKFRQHRLNKGEHPAMLKVSLVCTMDKDIVAELDRRLERLPDPLGGTGHMSRNQWLRSLIMRELGR